MRKNLILVVLTGAVLSSSVGLLAAAASQSVANIDLRVWQSTSDPETIYVSARPEGERWQPTPRVVLDDENYEGTWRFGDSVVGVELPESEVEVIEWVVAPPEQFLLQGRDNDGRVDLLVDVPIIIGALADFTLYVELTGHGMILCFPLNSLFPEDGFTTVYCNSRWASLDDIESIRARIHLPSDVIPRGYTYSSTGIHFYSCELVLYPDAPAHRYVCRMTEEEAEQ